MEKTEVKKESVIETALAKENITAQVIAKLKSDYSGLKINGLDDKEGFKKVEDARKECKSIRVLATKICKLGREEAVKIQKDWITKEKEVVSQIEEVENALEAESDRIKEEEKRILFEAAQKEKLPMRKEKLLSIGVEVEDEQLLKIDDNQFLQLFNELYEKHLAEKAEKMRLEEEERQKETEAKLAEEKRLEAEKQEAERKERERVEAEEKAKQDAEIARLKAENEAKEKREKEREKQIKEMEDLQQKRLSELLPFTNVYTDSGSVNMSRLWEETEESYQTILKNRKAKFEKLQKEQAEAEAKQKALEKELADKKAAEEKQKAEAEAIEKAKKEAEKKAAKAPDKEKLKVLITQLTLEAPKLSTKEGVEKWELISDKFAGFKKWATEQIESI